MTDSRERDPEEGSEPDARFTFANERTFLAWSRTALALVVAGLAIVQLLPPFPGVPWGRHVLGVPLIVLGAVVAVTAYREWGASQRALRLGKPVARSIMPRLLTVTIALMAVISAVVVLVSALRLCSSATPRTRRTVTPGWPGSGRRWPGRGRRSPSPRSAAWC